MSHNRAAFITGLSGQDGSYLLELLVDKDYTVEGIVRRSSSSDSMHRLDPVYAKNEKVKIHYGDITDSACMSRLIYQWYERNKDTADQFEVYNLAAQSHVQVSFELPEYTNNTNIAGIYNVLNAILALPKEAQQKVRFYQASSSEMFGKVQQVPQTEKTPFYPRSPYAVSKVAGFWATVNYRESFGLFASNGILFNHESARRGKTFVTRKITVQIGEIMQGKRKHLTLGNLNALRDWGHAKDYVRAMWMILQHTEPGDFVVATNEQHSVREFVERAFRIAMGVQICWQGNGLDEVGYEEGNKDNVLVRVSSEFFRAAEVESLLGDASKIHREVGWQATIDFGSLVSEMVDADCV